MNSFCYTFEKSRSGEIVPIINLPDGKTQPLHSLVDPKREAQRYITSITKDIGFMVFLGLGGGFFPEAALELTNSQVVIIDFDKDSVAQLFAGKDYSKLTDNSRFTLLTDPNSDELKSFLLAYYKPALYNGLKTIPLRTRIEQDRKKFEKAAATIQEALEIIQSDFSVQSHFGLRWFSNIIRNVKNIKEPGENIFFTNQIDEVAIVAAGPSLDSQLDILIEKKIKKTFIICSDTALPVLLNNGIEPDAVVSIDCQFISYYHFLGCKLKQNIPLILDITSPPMLSSLSMSPVFFSSSHPLALYLCKHWQHFRQLDTSGGNVTYTCLSLAENIGAKHITLFGADFAYVNCQTYAKGTYINSYFSNKQNRLTTLEAQMSSFLYRSPFLPCEDSKKNNNYYETSSFRFYRKKLEEKAAMMDCTITCLQGLGAPINIQKKINKIQNIIKKQDTCIQNRNISGLKFLKQYKNDIAALPKIDNDINKLNAEEKQVFTTLLPFMAAVKKRNPALKTNDLIEEVKLSCINEIEKVLNTKN